ncbi:MAG: c-type cytochrome [Planctomycetota bacterium]
MRPLTDAWTTSHLHAGQFSAACGLTRGLGTALPAEWRDDLVVCEPTGNLVQRQTVARRPIGHHARRDDRPQELLASRHPWFRPVDTIVGPDGALYVVDMCRAVIEHPDWAPAELKDRADQRLGDRCGRIWRLAVREAPTTAGVHPKPSTPEASADRWRSWLSHPNPWHRATASRMLVQSTAFDASVSSSSSTSVSPAGLARELRLLARSERLSDPIMVKAVRHVDANVRRVAAELLSRHDPMRSQTPTEWIVKLLDDDDAWVRLTAMATVVDWARRHDLNSNHDLSLDLETTLLSTFRHADQDHFWEAAVASLPSSFAAKLMIRLVGSEADTEEFPARLTHALARSTARSLPDLDAIGSADLTIPSGRLLAIVAGWCKGRQQRSGDINAATSRSRIMKRAQTVAAQCAVDGESPLVDRRNAIVVLSWQDDLDPAPLLQLVRQDVPEPLRWDALNELLQRRSEAFLGWLRDELAILPASLRTKAITQMITRSDSADRLLRWIEEGLVPSGLIPPGQADRLRRHNNADIRDRARSLFAAATEDRQALISTYQPATRGLAKLHRGRQLFVQHCATCHRLDDVGVQVGPDISDSRSKTPQSLLAAILAPNAAIDAGFVCYQWLTIDGEVQTGLLLHSDNEQVALKTAEGRQVSARRDELEAFRATGKSLMPDGFERVMDVNQMRDLIGYLKGWRYAADGTSQFNLSKAVEQ